MENIFNETLKFKGEVQRISELFDAWSGIEQCVAIRCLVKKLTPTQSVFISNVMEANFELTEDQEYIHAYMEEKANDPAFINSLNDEPQEEALLQATLHIPMLTPGNSAAKNAFLTLSSKIFASAVQSSEHLQGAWDLLSYLLIHPAVEEQDRYMVAYWLQRFKDCVKLRQTAKSSSDSIARNTSIDSGLESCDDRMAISNQTSIEELKNPDKSRKKSNSDPPQVKYAHPAKSETFTDEDETEADDISRKCIFKLRQLEEPIRNGKNLFESIEAMREMLQMHAETQSGSESISARGTLQKMFTAELVKVFGMICTRLLIVPDRSETRDTLFLLADECLQHKIFADAQKCQVRQRRQELLDNPRLSQGPECLQVLATNEVQRFMPGQVIVAAPYCAYTAPTEMCMEADKVPKWSLQTDKQEGLACNEPAVVKSAQVEWHPTHMDTTQRDVSFSHTTAYQVPINNFAFISPEQYAMHVPAPVTAYSTELYPAEAGFYAAQNSASNGDSSSWPGGNNNNAQSMDAYDGDGCDLTDQIFWWFKHERIHKYFGLFEHMTVQQILALSECDLETHFPMTRGARCRLLNNIQRLKDRPVRLQEINKEIEAEDANYNKLITELQWMLIAPMLVRQVGTGGQYDDKHIAVLILKVIEKLAIVMLAKYNLNHVTVRSLLTLLQKVERHRMFTPAEKRRVYPLKQQLFRKI